MAFVLSLFLPYLSFFSRLGKAMLNDYCCFWVSSFIFTRLTYLNYLNFIISNVTIPVLQSIPVFVVDELRILCLIVLDVAATLLE